MAWVGVAFAEEVTFELSLEDNWNFERIEEHGGPWGKAQRCG